MPPDGRHVFFKGKVQMITYLRIRKEKGIRQTEMVALLQLENVMITREALVKIERGIQHIQATQLRAIKNVLETTYDELLK